MTNIREIKPKEKTCAACDKSNARTNELVRELFSEQEAMVILLNMAVSLKQLTLMWGQMKDDDIRKVMVARDRDLRGQVLSKLLVSFPPGGKQAILKSISTQVGMDFKFDDNCAHTEEEQNPPQLPGSVL